MYTDEEYFLQPEEFIMPNKTMPRKMARNYFKWYLSIIPERMKILQNQVKEKNIVLDYSRESLSKLDDRFFTNLCYGQSKYPDNSSFISAETYTMCVDYAIYFGECLIKSYPILKWELNTRIKSDVDYQRPVIGGFIANFNFTIESLLVGNTLIYLGEKNRKTKNIMTFQYDRMIEIVPK